MKINDRLGFLSLMKNQLCLDELKLSDDNKIKYQEIKLEEFCKNNKIKLKYLNSGCNGHVFQGKNKNNQNISLKVVPIFRDSKNKNTSPHIVEIIIIKLLSELVKNKKLPHIILPIAVLKCDIYPFLGLDKKNIIDNIKYNEFMERYKNGEYKEYVNILVMEYANCGNFDNFIIREHKNLSIKSIKIFFFQILSTLALIYETYPTFRHNNYKPSNILLEKLIISKHFFRYRLKKFIFIVPNNGYQIRICDFDYATIPNLIKNDKANDPDNISVQETNKYYDLHFFFLNIILLFNELNYEPNIEVSEFLDRIVPLGLRRKGKITKFGKLKYNFEYLTPFKILTNDKFFEEFRKIITD